MAKLSTFSRDPKAMRDGEWIDPGPEYDGVKILTRAMTAKYADNVAGRTKRAASKVHGEKNLGQEERNRINLSALIDECLMDVSGLEHDDGRPVTFAEFCELILKDENAMLAILAFECAGRVGQRKAAETEEAVGNSLNASPLP